MRTTNGRKNHHSFVIQDPESSQPQTQQKSMNHSLMTNQHQPNLELGTRMNGRLSSQNLQQLSNLQENAYVAPPSSVLRSQGIKLSQGNFNLNDGKFAAARSGDASLLLNSPYTQGLKQQSLLKRQSVGAENKSTSVIGSALIHTQADSGSSVSIIPKKGAVNGLEGGNKARKVVATRQDNEEGDSPSDDQDYLHANIAAGITNNSGKRRQSQQHQFMTPNINNQRGAANANQQPILKPLNQKQIGTLLSNNQIISGASQMILRPPQNEQLPLNVGSGNMPSPNRRQGNASKAVTIDDQIADTGALPKGNGLSKKESKLFGMSPTSAGKKSRLTDIMPVKIGRQSEYNAERMKEMRQIQKHANELRMNATPTPQLIETDLRKIFNNDGFDNMSRAATQQNNETKTTTQARQPKSSLTGKVNGPNDYTAYNFKQNVPLPRFDGNRYLQQESKRPEGPNGNVFRQSFDNNKNATSNRLANSSSTQVTLKNKLADEDGSNTYTLNLQEQQDSGSFDMGGPNTPMISGFLPKYSSNHNKGNFIQVKITSKLNNSDGDILETITHIDNSPAKRSNVIRKPANLPNQHIEQQQQIFTIPRVDSTLKSIQSQSDLLSKPTTFQNESPILGVPSMVDSFAVKTRQGFIPSQAKPNQDSFISVKNLGGIEGLWMFGVCDGHGVNGHLVSDFVKKNLPRILSAMFNQVINNHSLSKRKKDNHSVDPNGKQKKKVKNVIANSLMKEDVVLPPLVKNQKSNQLNFQTFSQDQQYSGDESNQDSPERNLRRNNKSETFVPMQDEEQVYEEREHFYQWFRNKFEQRDTHIREAFRQTNERLDTSTRIDCMMSGTTVVVTLLYRNMIICANAGDSRAVMFSNITPSNNAVEGTPRSSWKPVPLSRDHKPEDSDEAARIRACNGRVEQSKIMPGMALFSVNGKPMNNLAGQFYGPKRVWLKSKQVPGLAMTRSLGDFVAKSVGVTSEPEIKVFPNLTENDRAMVIASDGIWDRIPNEEMAQVLQNYYEKKDPEGGAMELIRISVERWQRDHGMVDDITIVVVFLNGGNTAQAVASINSKQL